MTNPPLSKTAQRRSALRLLLSRGDSERPEAVLPQGLSPQLLDGAPAPHVQSIPAGRQAFGDQTRDASLLAERRWGLVLPAAEPLRGQLLSAIEPLIRVRAAQQGIDQATLLRELSYIAPADPYLPPTRAADWYRHTIAESDADDSQRRGELERPDYLLVLGDLHQVSENITSVLCSYGHFVGRLAFSDEAGQPRLVEYRQYAEKAAAAADRDGPTPDDEEDAENDDRSEPARGAEGLKPRRARLHYVSDGTDATELAHELLLSPLISRLGQPGKKGSAQDLNPMQAAALYNSDDLLNSARALSSSVLFTVSHGYGGPRAGYGSPAEQRRQQGALTFASTAPGRGRRLSGDDLRALRTPFLPGGVWFMLACYGAGTPAESQFYHWLASRRDRLDDEARWVLRSLPAPAQRQPDSHPFIAALPQAALAQPDGPLAIIGHLDLAWSYSFVENPESGDAERGDYDHFETLVRSLLRGARVGSALTTLLRKRRSAEQSLLRRYDAQRRAQFQQSEGASEAATDPERGPPVDVALRRHWMTRQDLIGYVLLGDPAARLWRHGSPAAASKISAHTLTLRPALTGPVEPAPQVTAAPAPAAPAVDPQLESKLRRIEDAICELTLGTGSPAALASALGLSEAELLSLQAAYPHAGRAALKP